MRYKSILKGVIVGGIIGIIFFFISVLGLIYAEIEALRPLLIPGIDRIVNPYFNYLGSGTLYTPVAAIFNMLIYATLGGSLTLIGSAKNIHLVFRVLLIVFVLFIFLWWTGMLYRFDIW